MHRGCLHDSGNQYSLENNWQLVWDKLNFGLLGMLSCNGFDLSISSSLTNTAYCSFPRVPILGIVIHMEVSAISLYVS